MPIIDFIPPKFSINDNRNSNGNYYQAKCDICGTDYFPKRPLAKYCSPKCKMVQHRISKLEEKLKGGNILPKKVVGTNDPKVKSMRGAINVYKFLKNIYDTRGDKDEILDELKYLDFEENYQYGKHKITRKSEQLFEIQK
jgi:hypothetical protein